MDEKSVIKTVPKCKNILGSEMDQGPNKRGVSRGSKKLRSKKISNGITLFCSKSVLLFKYTGLCSKCLFRFFSTGIKSKWFKLNPYWLSIVEKNKSFRFSCIYCQYSANYLYYFSSHWQNSYLVIQPLLLNSSSQT